MICIIIIQIKLKECVIKIYLFMRNSYERSQEGFTKLEERNLKKQNKYFFPDT